MRSASTRIVRVRRCDMNISANVGSSWITRMMAAFSSRVILAFHHRRDRRHAQGLRRQASFAKEITRSKDRNDCFFALLGNNGDLDLALLDVENSIRRISLREDSLILLVF